MNTTMTFLSFTNYILSKHRAPDQARIFGRFAFFVLWLFAAPVQASHGISETKPDTLYPISTLFNKQQFVYQLFTQEYITNENDFFLDVKLDTCFLIFLERMGSIRLR